MNFPLKFSEFFLNPEILFGFHDNPDPEFKTKFRDRDQLLRYLDRLRQITISKIGRDFDPVLYYLKYVVKNMTIIFCNIKKNIFI